MLGISSIIKGQIAASRRRTLDDIRNKIGGMETEGLSGIQMRKRIFHMLDELEPRGDFVHSLPNDITREY